MLKKVADLLKTDLFVVLAGVATFAPALLFVISAAGRYIPSIKVSIDERWRDQTLALGACALIAACGFVWTVARRSWRTGFWLPGACGLISLVMLYPYVQWDNAAQSRGLPGTFTLGKPVLPDVPSNATLNVRTYDRERRSISETSLKVYPVVCQGGPADGQFRPLTVDPSTLLALGHRLHWVADLGNPPPGVTAIKPGMVRNGLTFVSPEEDQTAMQATGMHAYSLEKSSGRFVLSYLGSQGRPASAAVASFYNGPDSQTTAPQFVLVCDDFLIDSALVGPPDLKSPAEFELLEDPADLYREGHCVILAYHTGIIAVSSIEPTRVTLAVVMSIIKKNDGHFALRYVGTVDRESYMTLAKLPARATLPSLPDASAQLDSSHNPLKQFRLPQANEKAATEGAGS